MDFYHGIFVGWRDCGLDRPLGMILRPDEAFQPTQYGRKAALGITTITINGSGKATVVQINESKSQDSNEGGC